MSVCGQTEDDSVSEEPCPGGAAREMHEQKAATKVVRVLTVLAYLLSVSLAAILLSVYYVCVWKSPKLPPINKNDTHPEGTASRQQGELADYYHNTTHSFNSFGGGNSTVNDVVTPLANITSYPAATDAPQSSPTDLTDSSTNMTESMSNLTSPTTSSSDDWTSTTSVSTEQDGT